MSISGNWEKRRIETFEHLGSIGSQAFARSLNNEAAELILGSLPLLERPMGAPGSLSTPSVSGLLRAIPYPTGWSCGRASPQSRWQRMDAGVCREIVFPCGGRWPPMKPFGGLCAKARHVRRPIWPTLCT